ncbi:MAG TPA: hypothetical protein VGR73_13390 [Bryobacteraceae bacterium]|nr:hypothetical protein [Bryobacteraceae bacterium]
MTTVARSRSTRRYDDLFFSGLAVLFLVYVFIGFARSYYLAGLFKAPLPNTLLHVHGAVFSLWVLLLIAQTSLVSAGRVDVHRRLGVLGFGLACVMVVLGVLVANDQLLRFAAHPPAEHPGIEAVRAFYAIPLGEILMFGTLVYFSFRNRSRPAVHKRLMLIATIVLVEAAVIRWPIFDSFAVAESVIDALYVVPLLLLLMAYDWWSTGRVQVVTLWAGAFAVVGQQARYLIGHTGLWQTFAAWVQTWAFSFQ